MQDAGGRIKGEVREQISLCGAQDKGVVMGLLPPCLKLRGGCRRVFIILILLFKSGNVRKAQREWVRAVPEDMAQSGARAAILRRWRA